MINQKQLKERLDYNPETGLFHWKRKTSNSMRPSLLAGGIDRDGYNYIVIQGKSYCVHRLAWLFMDGDFPSGSLDHINQIRSDNRWINLRQATNGQNACNSKTPSKNTSGVKGVSWIEKRKRWQASLVVDGKQVFAKRFKNLDEAKSSIMKAREQFHKDFASH